MIPRPKPPNAPMRHSLNQPSTPPPSSSIPSGSTEEWPCSVCTFLNKPIKKRCELCLTARPRPKIHQIHYSDQFDNTNINSNLNSNLNSNSKHQNSNSVNSIPSLPRHHFSVDSKSSAMVSQLRDRRKRKRPNVEMYQNQPIAYSAYPYGNAHNLHGNAHNVHGNSLNVHGVHGNQSGNPYGIPYHSQYQNSNYSNNSQYNPYGLNNINFDQLRITVDEEEDIQHQHSHQSHVRVLSHVNHLSVVPKGSIFADSVNVDSLKVGDQSVLGQWMLAQMERARGEQPSICQRNGLFLTNLQRVRAPTTQQTLQRKIDSNFHSNALAAGDWTDDEEEDPFVPLSPTEEEDYSVRRRHHKNTQSASGLRFNKHEFKMNNQFDNDFDNHFEIRKAPPPAPLQRTVSNDDVQSLALRQWTRNRSLSTTQSVASLWFSSQSQLREGRNPPILAKFNITLTNIRQHNPRFRDYQRRRSQHEKAATYLQVTGDKLERDTVPRSEIDYDDDDWSRSETEGDGVVEIGM